MVKGLRSAHGTGKRAFQSAFDYIEKMVYQRHLPKELYLFRLLEERGISHSEGSLAQIHREHNEIRSFVNAGRRILPDAVKGSQIARRMLEENMLAYIGLMERHINQKNRMFEIAEKVLSGSDEQATLTAFSEIDAASSLPNLESGFVES